MNVTHVYRDKLTKSLRLLAEQYEALKAPVGLIEQRLYLGWLLRTLGCRRLRELRIRSVPLADANPRIEDRHGGDLHCGSWCSRAIGKIG